MSIQKHNEMVFKNGVTNIQVAGYNGARTVDIFNWLVLTPQASLSNNPAQKLSSVIVAFCLSSS